MTQPPFAQRRAGRRGGLAIALAVATTTGVLGLGAASATAATGERTAVAVAATNIKSKGIPIPCHRTTRIRHGRRTASAKARQRSGYLR